MVELILGGARSGKSTLAERLAQQAGVPVTYIATATADDAEMAARIQRHRSRRPSAWVTVEEPVRLAQTLQRYAAPRRCLIVDCLTLWLSNLLGAGADAQERFRTERAALLHALPSLDGRVILVSNEVGMGVVPLGELNRRYVDEAGRLHQDLAALCGRVTWVVAGLSLVLKGAAP
jgi:adenosylcobinamide kinase/adenosylcobinamide-phosphate guanylyltransferase